MEDLMGDPFIFNQAVYVAPPPIPPSMPLTLNPRAHSLSDLEDCSIAVDATYYLQLHLDALPGNEPLLPALGGLTGIQGRIENELDLWKAHRITPFFIFDGQSVVGQEETAVKRGLEGIAKTDVAWELYFNSRADEAVAAFGQNISMPVESEHLYPFADRARFLPHAGPLSPSPVHLEAAGPALPGPAFQRRRAGKGPPFSTT